MDTELFDWLVRGGVTALIAALGYLARLLGKNIKSSYVKGVLERAKDAATRGMLSVQQTFVDGLKDTNEDGVFGKEEQIIALHLALARAKMLIGPKGLRELAAILGGGDLLDGFLKTEIEANVAASKKF